MKIHSSRTRSFQVGFLLTLFTGSTWANPSGGTVAQGAASIASSGNTVTVTQSTDRAVVNWNSFSVGAGEVTKFIQPSSTSAILNRVTGGSLSQISGSIQANGQVFLLNPNGIVFNAGSTVNTAGFLASTLNVSDSDFLAGGNLRFSGNSTGKITNLGNISVNGGDIYLIAKEVENKGTLAAPGGTIGLAGATDVLLAASGNDKVLIQPASGQGTVTNTGTIEAAVATLKAVGGNEYALAINNGGIIRATGSATVDGRVLLFAEGGTTKNTGTITAQNQDGKGGHIETSGESVELLGTIQTAPGGEWLIDPTNLTIDATAAATIVTALNTGTNVTEQTTATTTSGSGTTASGSGDITVASAITWTGTGSLILDAYNSIYVNANITASSASAGLTLSYGSNGLTTAGYTLGGASSITLPASTTALKIGKSGSLRTYTVVTTAANLISAVNTTPGGNYALGASVSAPTAAYTADPIASLTGYLDGLGHTISGLTLTDATDTNIGFIGANSGTLSNFGLTSETVTSTKSASLVGGLVGKNTGTITASYITGTVIGNTATNVGGLVGSNAGGTISLSFASASVSGTSAATVGGLAGTNSAAISNSYAVGSEAGGVTTTIGPIAGTNTGTLANSYAYESVSGTTTGTIVNASAASTSSGLTLAQMELSSSFGTGWTFTPLTGTWGLNGYTSAGQVNGGLPYLQWQSPLTQAAVIASAQSVTYGSAPNLSTSYTSAGGTLTTYITGSVALALSGSNVNAGTTNFIVPTATVKAGSTVEFQSALETITTAPLTITASNASKTYGSEQTLSAFSVTGLKYSDAVNSVTLGSLGTAKTANVAAYTLSASGATGVGLSNYTITYVAGTDTVNTASLTIKASDLTKTYGTAQTLTQYAVTGLKNSDAVNSVTLSSSGTAAAANVGSYAITASGAVGSGLTNYTITYLAGIDLINPAILTYTANRSTRAYGTANPAFGGTVTGFVLGQTQATATTGTLAFTSTATKTTDSLTAAIKGGGLTANNGNYTFTQASGNASALTITGAPLSNGQTVQVRTTAATTGATASSTAATVQNPATAANGTATAAKTAKALAKKDDAADFGDTSPFSSDGDTVTVGKQDDSAATAKKGSKTAAVIHAPGLPSTISYAQPPAGQTSGNWYSYLPNLIYGTSSSEVAARAGH
ncbi:filamentous hemagglutinin family N-terminal domain-containing protein [Verrucomicrobium sp. GAS474]|uniref:beta strand repeat-containing protein n=1 Tax=Verrucomicrobium sp. GAS474 TaxID=1882831 RepID=UPI00087B2DFC|nr:MBG domain-containing protein [Verrucomicrobium sp. GAS474]SDU15684.1 filamentous hemagglutinin family N-terminal domain-containing protein [Verrucomicrobium sp. GAS474]